jgi:DNA-binding winged helix-turn-helix (wHTH) protein
VQLVRHAGQIVHKDTLLNTVWPETSVGDGVLKNCLGELRHLLGETAREPRFIATVHCQGYRFIAPVTTVASLVTLPAPASVPETAPTPPSPERRQLTVLFCAVAASTTLAMQLDPEDFQAVMQAYQQRGAEVVARFEGRLAQHLGDGLLAYFGYPQAHEDDAQRAIHAGLELLQALEALHTELFPRYQVPLHSLVDDLRASAAARHRGATGAPGAAVTDALSLQACPDTGSGLRLPAAPPPSAATYAHRRGAGSASGDFCCDAA